MKNVIIVGVIIGLFSVLLLLINIAWLAGISAMALIVSVCMIVHANHGEHR